MEFDAAAALLMLNLDAQSEQIGKLTFEREDIGVGSRRRAAAAARCARPAHQRLGLPNR